jgi:hypothetical protein
VAFQNNVPIPHYDPVVKPDRFLTEAWERWFDQLQIIIEASVVRIASVNITAGTGIIIPTDLSDGGLDSGLYRVSYYARITTPATVNSSLTISFTWTDGGVTQAFAGAAIVGNTTTSYESDTQLIHVDALSPVQYAAAYASVGIQSMEFALYITLEEVQA